jgi:hypothetical protein
MLLRLLFVFAFGLGVGALGISRALEALSVPAPAVSSPRAARPLEHRALRTMTNRLRLPRSLPVASPLDRYY